MIELEKLPWPLGALRPILSGKNIAAHRVLHERYVDRVNELATGQLYRVARDQGLPGLIKEAKIRGDNELYNNAAQALNHQFFWHSLRPYGSYRPPQGRLRELLMHRHADIHGVTTEAVSLAGRLFGSGWLWLTLNGWDEIRWRSMPNAVIPEERPLLCIDLWEHAYYFDFLPERVYGPSARQQYVAAVLEHLVNWEFAEANLGG